MSKRRHNFGTKRFKEKSLFIFHARIALKSLILLFVRLIARGARIGKTHTHRQTHKTSTVTLAHARRGLMNATTRRGRTRYGALRTRFHVHKSRAVPHRVALQGNATYCEPGFTVPEKVKSEKFIALGSYGHRIYKTL